MKIKKTTVILLAFFLLCAIAVMLVPSNQNRDEIRSVEDLSGKTVGVQNSTMNEVYVLEKNPEAQIQIFTDIGSGILSLLQKKIDALATEEITYHALKIANPEIMSLGEPVGESQSAFGFAETVRGEKLYHQMQDYIAECNENGRLAELEEYWVKNYDPDTCRSDPSGLTGENGTVTVAVEAGFEGFSNMVEGELCGFDIDYVYGFCRKYGYIPEFQQMDFDGIAPSISTGKCDFGTGIIISEEREEGLLLTDGYFTNRIYIVVAGVKEDENFIESVKNSFYRTFIKENRWKMLLEGTGVTLLITVSSVVAGTLLGFGAYLLIKDGDRVSEGILNAISWVTQGLPSLVLLMILYYVLFGKKEISGTVVSIIGFSLVFGCAVFEMIGNGVKAVGTGQYEAARAQGFSSTRTFFEIILPQAAFHFLPNYKGEVSSLLKETSVVGYIAILDLTKMADMIRSRTFDAFFPLIASALIYMLLIVLLTAVIDRVDPLVDITKRKIPKDLVEFRDET